MDDIQFRTRSARSAPQPPTSKQRSTAPSHSPRPHAAVTRNGHKPATVAPGNHFSSKSADKSNEEPFVPLHRLKDSKPRKNKPKKRAIRTFFVIIGASAMVVLLAWGGFAYLSGRGSELAKAMDTTNNTEELALAIKKQVSKYLQDVPAETPKLDTIGNIEASGPGFQDTLPGDKVLYFESAGKAIIYRPSTGKILVYTYFTGSSSNPQPQSDQSGSELELTDPDTLGESTSPSPLLP